MYDGEIFEHNGRQFRLNIEPDADYPEPWDEADGWGPVSEWTRREKRPGEVQVAVDGYYRRFYDLQAANRQAKAEGWGLGDKDNEALAAKLGRAPTRGERRAEAVRRDMRRVKSYLAGEWWHVGVIVAHIPPGAEPRDVEPDYAYATWGIESDDDEGVEMYAHEHAAEIEDALNAQRAELLKEVADSRARVHALAEALRQERGRPYAAPICDALRAQLRALRSNATAAVRELRATR